MKTADIETEKSNAVAVLQMALSPALRFVCNFFVIIFYDLIVMIWFAVQSNNEYRRV